MLLQHLNHVHIFYNDNAINQRFIKISILLFSVFVFFVMDKLGFFI